MPYPSKGHVRDTQRQWHLATTLLSSRLFYEYYKQPRLFPEIYQERKLLVKHRVLAYRMIIIISFIVLLFHQVLLFSFFF